MLKDNRMQTKIDALAAPATVATGSVMLFLSELAENGLPLLVQYGNLLLIIAGVLLAFSKWRTSRIERKLLQLKLDAKQREVGQAQ
jgi:Mn-dependent DtxR family transcriptional regulator